MGWSLNIGGQDVSPFVLNGASFTETASSSTGNAHFSLNGSFSFASGTQVTLTNTDGNVAWEGFVASTMAQPRADGSTVSTQITAAGNAALFAVGTSGGSYQNTDVATIAQAVAANAGVPWGGPSSFGIEIGALTFTSADDALTTLATLAQMTWGVRGGQLQFIAPWLSGITAVPVVFNASPNSIYTIDVLGGVDSSTRLPLAISVNGLGVTQGQTCYVNQPEIGDSATLGVYAGSLAEWYDGSSVTGQMVLPSSPTVRAGDWLEDQNGIVTIVYSVNYALVGGSLTLNVQLGFPPLPQNRQYSLTFAESVARQPAARLHTDCVVSGCNASVVSGTQISLSTGTVILSGATVALSGQTITLPVSGTFMLEANATGFFYTNVLSAPPPGTAVLLYQATTFNGAIVQNNDIRSFGGVGTLQLKPATPGTPGVTLNSISLSGEGATQCFATINFTVTGVTLDDTIDTIDVAWSIAGQNNWHPRIPAVHTPTTPTATAYIHGLAAGQNYDIGVTIRGRNGVALNATPMVLGTSPTISSSAIAIALNLDQVSDGVTYARTKASELVTGFVKQLNDGSIVRTATNVAAVVNASNNVPASTAFNSVTTSILPFTTDFKLTVVVGAASAYAWSYYFFGTAANNTGGSGNGVTFILPDGSSFNPGPRGTSSSPILLNSQPNPTTGHTVYFMIFWKNDTAGSDQVWVNNSLSSSSANGTGWRVAYQYDNAFSPQSYASAVADGGYQATLAQASNAASFSGGSGGGGSKGGCPEIDQLIEVCRVDKRGRKYTRYVKAKSLVRPNWMAQWVRDPDGGWNAIIQEPRIEKCQVWEVQIGGETVRVDASHMFRDAQDRWINVQSLRPGHRMHYFDRSEGAARGVALVESVQSLGPGHFVALHCERERYVLGKSVSHNSKYY